MYLLGFNKNENKNGHKMETKLYEKNGNYTSFWLILRDKIDKKSLLNWQLYSTPVGFTTTNYPIEQYNNVF